MSVSFNQIPADLNQPLLWIEVDPSKAGTVTLDQPAIIYGQKFDTGTAPADLPIAIGSLAQAKAAFGEGSQIERMFAAFFKKNAAAFLWGMPVVEPSGGTAASGTLTFSAPPTEAGIFTLYIAGQRVQAPVSASSTTADVAAALVTAVAAIPTLPVTAVQGTSANNNRVTFTCKWKGSTGNDVTLIPNYGGTLAGEALPKSLTLALVAMSGGAGAPDLTAAIANSADSNYAFVAFPWTDSVSLGAIETEYGFGDNGRWGWMRQSYGGVFSARRDTYANQIPWGKSGNSPVSTIMDVEPDSPTPIWEWAAEYCAIAARAYLNDPARPLQTLEFDNALPAPQGKRRKVMELKNLASSGMATQAVSGNGKPMITVETTRYQKNVLGQPDNAYQHMTTLFTLSAIFQRMRQRITSKYPRHKLANDGTRFGPGQAMVTPKIIKAELIATYREYEYEGLVENGDAFKSNLVVQRDTNSPTRVNVVYPPDLVNQLRVFAVLAQFRLQYSTIDQAA